MIKTAKGIIKLGKIEDTGDGFFKVDGDIVRVEKKAGRTLLRCSCKNCTTFCNDIDKICSRKLAVVLYESQNFDLKRIIRENLIIAKQSKELGISIDPDLLISLLEDLKGGVYL